MKKVNLHIILTFLCMFILLAVSIYAQPNPVWVRSFNNSSADDNDVTQKSITDGAGNTYIIAYSKGTTTNYDFLTLKYNAAGDLLWSKRYNNDNFNGVDDPDDIAVDANGNVYVIGTSNRTVSKSDVVLIKYSPNGTQLWVRRSNLFGHIAGEDADARAIAISQGGNVYISYDFEVLNYQGLDYEGAHIVKYNSAGDSLLLVGILQQQNGVNSVGVADIAVDNNENIISCYNYNNDIAMVKYNTQGANVWVKYYDGDSTDIGIELKIGPDGHMVCIGRSFKINQGFDYITLKFGRDDGSLLWEKRYNNPQASMSDLPYTFAIDDNGNIIVTGFSMSTGDDNDILTLKYSASGSLVWEKRYNGAGSGNDQGRGVVTDNAGNVYVSGLYYKNGSAGTDFITLKYTSAGALSWASEYALTWVADQPVSMGMDNAGNLYITGRIIRFLNTDEDVAIFKYASTIGIQQISGEVPEKFELSQNYPNPFNPVTNIKFSIPKQGNVKLVVFDITGRQVAELVNEQLSAGSYNFDFNASGLSSGAYFYKLVTNEFTDVKKMILVK